MAKGAAMLRDKSKPALNEEGLGARRPQAMRVDPAGQTANMVKIGSPIRSRKVFP
jgi:hypothetical protein